MKLKKCLIIGSEGFVGTNLQEYAKKNLNNIKIYTASKNELNRKNHFSCNVCKKEQIENLLNLIRPDYIIFLAAKIGNSRLLKDLDSFYQVNYNGVKNLLEAITEYKISLDKLILFSSAEVYGKNASKGTESTLPNPISIYSLSKIMADNLAKFYYNTFEIPIIILRPSLIYGHNPKGNFFIDQAIKNLMNNKPFNMTSGSQNRDFIFIEDVCEATFKILKSKSLDGEILNLSYGKSYKLKEVILKIKEMTLSASKINFGTIPMRTNEIMNYKIPNEKIKKELNWKPKFDLNKSLKEIIKKYE